MRKKMMALLLSFVLVLAFSLTCFAASSPRGRTRPARNGDGDGSGGREDDGSNNSHTSPKTGTDIAGAFIAVITASGIALVSKKEYSKC